jgi:hypothetical protein
MRQNSAEGLGVEQLSDSGASISAMSFSAVAKGAGEGKGMIVVRAPNPHRILLHPGETAAPKAPSGIVHPYFETVVNLFTVPFSPSLVPSGRIESTV